MVKVFLKVSFLIFLLVMVIGASRYFSSEDFKNSINALFNIQGRPFQWCRGEAQKFKWLDPQVELKYKTWSETSLAQKFCTLQLEKVEGIDLKQAHWSPLAESIDANGRASQIDWDRELKIFRVAGLPFKSSFLYFDLTK